MYLKSTLILLYLFLLAGCTNIENAAPINVTLVVDGREQIWSLPNSVTVSEFLRDRSVTLGPLDRVTPSDFTQISDKMRITVVRVREENECGEESIPYKRQTVYNEGLAPGEELLGQAGKNGVQKVCYRILVEDEKRGIPIETSRVTTIEPQDEIVIVGPTGQIEPVPIIGTLAYISSDNAWVIRGSSTQKTLLTLSNDLDKRIFSLSSDGRKLLFSRKSADQTGIGFRNELWMMPDIRAAQPEAVKLAPEDVLYADWVPERENTISYSIGEPRETAPGWKARNDLWLMRIDPQSGESLRLDQILEPSISGLYSFWGTDYKWSPNGQYLVWIRAEALGLVNIEAREIGPALLSYSVFRTSGDWSWRSSVSWSPDSSLIAATVHGPPIGSEAAETSPAFDIAISAVDGSFKTNIVEKSGMWSSPKYSPLFNLPDTQFPQGYLAYLRARDIGNSINNQAEYDLIVADRDSSNARKIFPETGQPGLNPQEFVWSPDGRQIAFIYLGNLWVIDVESRVAHQLTLDGAASRPVWAQ